MGEQAPEPQSADTGEGPEEEHDARLPLVIGIGATVAALDSLRVLLAGLRPDPCRALVVVLQHGGAVDAKRLAELASPHELVLLKGAEAATLVRGRMLYVVLPDAVVTLSEGYLQVRAGAESLAEGNGDLDGFLVSLAHDRGAWAMAVVLHGLGGAGTLGVMSLKELGGVVLAERQPGERSAAAPSASVEALADVVLPVEALAAGVEAQLDFLHGEPARDGPDDTAAAILAALHTISNFLRNRTGHDFHGVGQGTFVRRIRRRMQVLQMRAVADYVERLRNDGEEVQNLFNDLLIGVTRFFRDAAEFQELETGVIPQLFHGRGAKEHVRVWVLGCATGEEAYSLAILLREHMARLPEVPHVQIFGTDIDPRALAAARTGRYGTAIEDHVGAGRLERWFAKEGNTYRVTKELREMCIFSAHDVLRDAPFSRLDLISCRNLLISLNSELQDQVIPLFHFALRPGGFLFLGNAENVTRHSRLFAALDPRSCIFSRRETSGRNLPPFPLSPPVGPSPSQSAGRVAQRDPFAGSAEAAEPRVGNAQTGHLERLEQELRLTRERLQAAIEELETANEELKSSNEEYQSLNEELQSANEELETSKEELQSVNEELTTVNGELAQRVQELTRASSDLKNFLESTQIPTVFLDNQLRVMNFTPAITEIFNLVEADIGRPIAHIRSRVPFEDLQEDIRRVLRNLGSVERTLENPETRARYIARVLPYRSVDDFIAGVVLTYVDVTAIARAEERHKLLLAELQHRVRNTLGVVRSIARRTADNSSSVTEFAEHLDGRLAAFARVQSAVTRDPSGGVDLATLVGEELVAHAAHEGERVVVRGPPLRLQSNAAESLALGIHELATNAVKYGALSVPQGRIRVEWAIQHTGAAAPDLQFCWIESGVPEARRQMDHRGFGMELLERTLRYELRANAGVSFDEDGLRCHLRIPLTERVLAGDLPP